MICPGKGYRGALQVGEAGPLSRRPGPYRAKSARLNPPPRGRTVMGRIALGVCFAAAAWAGTACAGTMTVTSLADDGAGVCDATCTLRDAVASAASGDQIVFSNSLTLPG